MKTNLGLRTSQQLALTPQLQQSIKLLQMSTVELREELESKILENPLLEFEESTESPQIEDQQDTKLIEESVNSNNENHGSQHTEENSDNFDNQKQYESSNETDYKNNEIWSHTKPSKSRISNDDPGDFRENLKEAPIPLTQIFDEFVNSMGVFDWVPQETVVRVRLRLDVTALGPSAHHG